MNMDVKIEKLVYGGEGLGHHDGHTVFVPFVLPDEIVTVRPTDRRKKFVRARVEQVVTPSPQRTPAPCPYFGTCGGCHYQHMPYEAQLAYKTEILRETLRRIGRIEWVGAIHTHASPPFGYRNRAQWKIRPASEGTAAAMGYFQASSAVLCPIAECPIISPRLGETLSALGGLLAKGQLSPKLREVEAFADSADAKLLINASLENFDNPSETLADTLRDALPGAGTILLQDISRDQYELFGPGFLYYEVAGKRYRVGHLSFFQVNRFLIEDLVHAVVADERGALALDLFAGVGLFALALAQRFERVLAVESDLAASRDLQANIDDGKAVAQQVNVAVESFLPEWKERPDFVVLDPPRAGIAAAALERLAQLSPPRIAYLSCDPATLARDLRALVGSANEPHGYEISDVDLFDLFPQTYHIESLVRLRRRE